MIEVRVRSNMGEKRIIVSEDTTIRAALESERVNYSIGTTCLDGSPLRPGDMDKTFGELGVTERCFLVNVVKADNAATVAVAGSVCVITSAMAYDDIATLAKYRPAALVEVDEDKNPVFAIGVKKTPEGALGQYGAEFGTAKSADGKATITIDIPAGVEKAKEWVADKFGGALQHLNKIEGALAEQVTAVKAEQKAILDSIQTL